FAIIRGLEDRYSSTTYNGAPIPSPDPDRQSVQLDLFPSDVVGDLVVAKNFGPQHPGNSAGGSIDIRTFAYPEDGFEISLSGGSGWNDNARDTFLEYHEANPLGSDSDDTLESDFGGSFGARTDLFGREVRFKGVLNREIDYETLRGYQEERQPDRVTSRRGNVLESGDMSLGIASLSGGLYDYTESTETTQDTGFAALGFDLDAEGNHKLDGTYFWTKKDDKVAGLYENGFFPNVDYGPILDRARLVGVLNIEAGSDFEETAVKSSSLAGFRDDAQASRGHVFYTIFEQAENFRRERELEVYQLNGDHTLTFLDDLALRWAANYATTELSQSAFSTDYFYEPDDPQAQIPDDVPRGVGHIGPGQWAVRESQSYDANDIDETQYFARGDLEYERQLLEGFDVTLSAGGWYEDAERDVDALFLNNPAGGAIGESFVLFGDSPQDATGQIFDTLGLGAADPLGSVRTTNESKREIQAAHGGLKTVLWQSLDLLGGVRFEDIHIESNNDPFQSDLTDGSPNTFPSRWVLFDRYDNPALGTESGAPRPGSQAAIDKVHNDQILGIAVPVDPTTGLVDFATRQELLAVVNGEIDDLYVLPSAGVAVRPPWVEGLTLRVAYSQTVARPSFREMGYYVTTEPGTNDRTIGNPKLDVSEVESWDTRVEYLFGDLGDLVAGSFFIKTIEDPIESIIVTDQADFTGGSAGNFRTFFNNPNEADLWGFEVESRLHLGLLGLFGEASDFLDHFSIGGNYTWIDAEVDRSSFEIARTDPFFGVAAGDVAAVSHYETSRRLFNQPRWIANADVSFEHPDLGTRVTLAWFAISDVLTSVGGGAIGPDGNAFEYTLDRYNDSFHQLDLVMSQEFSLPRELGLLTFKSSIKNLTDSRRKVVYDRAQLDGSDVAERRYRQGRDYSFSVKFTYDF
ncbi:MAG: hypothetical protein ACQGVC_20025, partial [Myxococcota bacterium]